MKTAIQELIEELKKRRSLIKEAYKPLNHLVDANSLVDIMIRQINHDIELAESMLEKEKEQIKEAYATGMLHPPKYCIDIDIVTNKQSEQYYNETFNPDQV